MPLVELTDRFCQSAKATRGKQTDFFDTVVKGLSLRVSPAGTRSWNLFYTKASDGKRARAKLGRYPEMTLGKARGRAREVRGEVGDGADPIAEKRARAAAQTVADLVENYIARHAATRRSGDEIARRLRKNVSAVIGAMKLSELHRRDLTRCIDAVLDRSAPVEANRLFEDMRAMVRWARGRGDLDQNLCEGMRRPIETTVRQRVLNADEIRTLWLALPAADMRESTRRILRLCLITGQRVGEIAGMTRNEVNLGDALWTIPPDRTKNGRKHNVPLSDMAAAIIRDQIAAVDALAARKDFIAPDWIFPGPGFRAAVTPASVPKAVARMTIANIAPWTPHDLRRSCATHMEELGISPLVIGHVCNHVTVTRGTITSLVYAKYNYAAEVRAALDLWADRLAAIVDDSRADMLPMRRSS